LTYSTLGDIQYMSAIAHGWFGMERKKVRRSKLVTAAVGLVLFCVAALACFVVLVALTFTVSGTAALPNGTTATINGAFSCSSNTATTEIEAGGRVFAFSPTTVSVDGVPVAALDATVNDVQIEASFWSASLRINGKDVVITR